jgi:hypothetical protein
MPHSLTPSQQTEAVAEHLLVVMLARLVDVVSVLTEVTTEVTVGLVGLVRVCFLVVVALVVVETGGFAVMVVVDGQGGGMGLAETAQTS